jgi:phosphodiesterase/alkaline phosphatase D-like protein
VLQTPVGQEVIAEIRRESTVTFREIVVSSNEAPRPTAPSIVAATTGLPRAGGARLHVASDLPARVEIEVSATPDFRRARRLAAKRTGAFDAATLAVGGLKSGRRAYWRATLHRSGLRHVGPVRSFPVLPSRGHPRRTRLAIAACGTQFGPIFDHLASARPDVFVWQGDLNYPDTHGPLAQTMSGYAGIWRDFLANPRLAPVLERSAFVAQRDDHDYAAQDSNSLTIPHFPWGVAPWDALLGDGIGLRFSAGLADVWVLDQRRFKSDPALPDTAAKTLLGDDQRVWLLAGLAASRAPFKLICSPCTVFMPFNARDGNWATGYTAERDAILGQIERTVSGQTLFVTGDTHFTGVYDAGGRFEARACPVDIPVPNDITLSDPQAAEKLRASPGVAYADDRGHFAVVEVAGRGHTATLNLWLVREDGSIPYRRGFEQPIPR